MTKQKVFDLFILSLLGIFNIGCWVGIYYLGKWIVSLFE